MTEPIFKAPLPPTGNGFTPPQSPKTNPEPKKVVDVSDIKQKIISYLWYVLGGIFVVGFILGLSFGGGDTTPPPAKCALNFVRNSDIRGNFPLCGKTSNTEPCIIYLMNTSPYDKAAEDFYTEVLRQTERSIQLIAMENPVYSKIPIPPGAFAQIKVPRLR